MVQKERLGDRRSDIRFEIIGQLWGSLESVEPLPLRNVGRGGALVESRLPLAADSVHGVRLEYDARVSTMQARVRHVTPIQGPDGRIRYLIGLEFVNPEAQALEQIDDLLTASGGRQLPLLET